MRQEREEALNEAVQAIRKAAATADVDRMAGMFDASNVVNAMTSQYQQTVAGADPERFQ